MFLFKCIKVCFIKKTCWYQEVVHQMMFVYSCTLRSSLILSTCVEILRDLSSIQIFHLLLGWILFSSFLSGLSILSPHPLKILDYSRAWGFYVLFFLFVQGEDDWKFCASTYNGKKNYYSHDVHINYLLDNLSK